ncbi:oxidoreductase family protein [Xylaria venustula]|nr:oxidoreductase family protein [Xylaria venustula]
MPPIRVALIGLSASAKVSWAEQGHLPYLNSERGKSHYELVALLNSSEEAAKAARAQYKLPRTVKTYGNPDDLAADKDIDLVVCNTRVDTHILTTAPSLRAGKAVFIEWPLAENYEAALSLTDNKRIDNSIIGLQGRVSPIALKLKEVLKSGRIGRVLSSDVRAFGNLGRRDSVSDSVSYFAKRRIGGNHVTIAYAHTIDYVHEVLGEWDSFQSRMQIQRPVLKIRDGNGVTTEREIVSDVPDLVAVHGKLGKDGRAEIPIVDNATLSFVFRSGQEFKGQPGFIWTINGEKGEIMVTANGAYIHSDSYKDPIDIKLHDFATDEVATIDWDWQDWQKELPRRSRIVAELYERFARWWEGGKIAGDLSWEQEWPRLHDAVVRMREFEELFRQYDAQDDVRK